MRISGTSGPSAAATSSGARRPAATGFALPQQDSTPAPTSTSALRTVGGIDALIALQGVEDPTARRKTAVKRGRLVLDALDELKIGLLGGTLEPATLLKLKSAAAFLKDGSGEPGLDAVLGEIELRAEVEIAKMAVR